MKMFLVLLMCLFSAQSFAGGHHYCDAKEGHEIHQSFCEGLDARSCRFHNSLCESYEYVERGCVAKVGYEVHENFCSGMDRQSCRFHNSLCEWSWGGWR